MEPLYQRAPRQNRRPTERGPRSDRTPAALIALVLLAVPGCADEPELPPIVWEGDYLRFGTDADEEICAGTLPYLDGVTGHLGEVFGHPGRKVDYYWLPDGTEEHCGRESLGCVLDEPVVYSTLPFLQHELVHAVRTPERLYLPLEEGLAEAYGDDWLPMAPVSGDIASILREHEHGRQVPTHLYPRLGHFVSYLLAEHGLEAVDELDRRTDYTDPYSALEHAFRETLESPLDHEVNQYESTYPSCDRPFFRNTDYDCGHNIVSAPNDTNEEKRMEVSLSCNEPTVLGPRLGHQWTTVTLDVQTPGRYFIYAGKANGEHAWPISLRECNTSCFESIETAWLTAPFIYTELCLDRTQYLFNFTDDTDFTPYEITIRYLGPSCN